MTDFAAIVRWYLTLLLLSAAFAPVALWLGARLSDRGASITRPLALLLAVYPMWLLSMVFGAPYSTSGLWFLTLVLGCVGWIVALRAKSVNRNWLRLFLIAELIQLGVFLAAVWLRGFTPELTGTEKPMDIAFLSSSALATTMPPPDPWFSGEPINYYYFGYLIFGAISRMAGIPATTGFNLALPTLMSMTVTLAGYFCWNALRSWAPARIALLAALTGGFLVAIAGNLYAPYRLLTGGKTTLNAWWWDWVDGIGWHASRIVCDGPLNAGRCVFPSIETINEFPFFSFLLGDLHPHLMALPFTLLALQLALSWLVPNAAGLSGSRRVWTVLVIQGGIIGGLYALNSWDYPVYLILVCGAIVLANRGRLRQALVSCVVLAVSSIVVWLPFWLTFVPPSGVSEATNADKTPSLVARIAAIVGFHTGERTSLLEYFTIFGLPAFVICLFLATDWRSDRSQPTGRGTAPFWFGAAGFALVAGLLLQSPVLTLCLLVVLVTGRSLLLSAVIEPATIATGLVFAGAGLSAIVELFYIRDVFESRMNTLFKVYYQVWVLYALAAAIALGVLVSAWWPRRSLRPFLVAGGVAGLLLGLSYPVVASWQWTDHFARWQGLDGIAYAREQYPDEAAAITWLQEHGLPGDTLLEAAGCSYLPNTDLPFDRFSAYTGVPTVIGWGHGHEIQWRRGQPELLAGITTREADVAAIYADPGGLLTRDYGLTWLIAGRYEREDWKNVCAVAGAYPGIDDADWPGPSWTLAFQSGNTAIYVRRDTATMPP